MLFLNNGFPLLAFTTLMAPIVPFVSCGGGNPSQTHPRTGLPLGYPVVRYAGSSGYGYGGHVSTHSRPSYGAIYASHQEHPGHVEGPRSDGNCPCNRFRVGQGDKKKVNGVTYDTVNKIGAGVQAAVYHAHHNGHCYAIKDAPQIEYEALTACRDCPNVVKLIDAQQVKKKVVRLVLELGEHTLAQSRGWLPREQLIAQAHSAVHQIHNAGDGYSHNDLDKLVNWMLFNGGTVLKLIDFGQATNAGAMAKSIRAAYGGNIPPEMEGTIYAYDQQGMVLFQNSIH